MPIGAEGSGGSKDFLAPPIMTFFYLVNQTATDITVRVSSDGQELFVQRLAARLMPSAGREAPPALPYPSAELKIPVPQNAASLEIQELSRFRWRRVFDIAGFTQAGAGFRVLIRDEGISLSQDYYPMR
jgi:hypothetical protein